MRTFILLVVSFTVVISENTLPITLKSADEIAAEKQLENARARIIEHWLKLREIFLMPPGYKPHHLLEESFNKYRNFTLELAQNLSMFSISSFHNEQLKRRVKRLSHLQISGLNAADYNKAQKILDSMKNLSTESLACIDSECKEQVAYVPDISIAIAKHEERVILRYWKAWRDAISKDAKKLFLEYIDLYRKAASLNGHVTPSKTWYLNFETNKFLDELTEAIEELRPLYKEFHAFMRHTYRNYGKTLSDDDPIPDHILEHIIATAWSGRAKFAVPYPDSPVPNTKKLVEDKFNALEILRKAADFYETLGLEQLPEEFWTKYALQVTGVAAGLDCKAQVFSFPPDVGIKYCPKAAYRTFLQMHGHMAEIHYHLHRGRLPFGQDGEALPGIGSAIGEAVIVSASSHRHLERIGFMNATNSRAAFNRLFRMGVHTIFTLSRYFVYEKLWVDALDHKIKPDNLNCGFWSISEKYMGVSPPIERSEEYFDPGYKFYYGLDDNTAATTKIISELLGYQIYRSLCLKSGKYIPNDKNYPLHNCDFYDQKEAGDVLREVMDVGSSRNWRDVVGNLTGERRISASALMEYYEPLHQWLKEQNQLNGAKAGWKSTELCDS